MIVVALSLVYWLNRFMWRSTLKKVPVSIGSADAPMELVAGNASLRGDLLGTLIQASPPRLQARLKAVSRGMRDAVCAEVSDWTQSFTELGYLSMLAEKPVDTLLEASTLHLPGRDVVGFLSAEDGKGVGVLLRFSSNLHTLYLSRNQLHDEGAAYVAETLKRNSCLTALHMDTNEIGDDGAVAIADSLLLNRSLTRLDLSENGLGAEVHFRHEGESAGIGDAAAKAFAASLAVNTTLRTLLLSSCEVGDVGAHALLACVRDSPKCALTELDLSFNQIGNQAQQALRTLAAPHARDGAAMSLRV